MPCISIALYNCVEHPLPPVICCPNVFLPYGWDLPSSSLPPHLHTHSSLPASRFCCPSCTAVRRLYHVMSCGHLICPDQRSSPLRCRSATGACSPAHARSAQPRTTSREWLGAKWGLSRGHASARSNDEHTPSCFSGWCFILKTYQIISKNGIYFALFSTFRRTWSTNSTACSLPPQSFKTNYTRV